MRRLPAYALIGSLFAPVAMTDHLDFADIQKEVCAGNYTMKIGTNTIKLEGHEPYIAQLRRELPDSKYNLFYYVIIGEPEGALAIGYIDKNIDLTRDNKFKIVPVPEADKALIGDALKDKGKVRVLSCQ